jgi:hypothetical protein
MTSENPSTATAGRNRIVAIAAGAITVIAIVLALASGYLGLTWLWLRPAAELLLLAELVGLIVLERHQLFEPVHDRVEDIYSTLATLMQQIGAQKPAREPILMTNSVDYYHVVTGLMSESKHEVLMVVRGEEILVEQAQPFIQRTRSTVEREKQLHVYLVIASHLGELKEEAFSRRLAAQNDPAFEGGCTFGLSNPRSPLDVLCSTRSTGSSTSHLIPPT